MLLQKYCDTSLVALLVYLGKDISLGVLMIEGLSNREGAICILCNICSLETCTKIKKID